MEPLAGSVSGGARQLGPTGGRGILQIHPSLRCNLSCLHCYSSSGPDGSHGLAVEPITQLIEDAADLSYSVLGVSGGEPLLYADLPKILGTAKGRGMTTTVTTNGVLLTEARIEALRGLVDVIAISLDGTPSSHTRMRGDPQAFEHMASRLPALASSGITFGFVFTLTQSNVHELEWVVEFANQAGASLVQIHPLEAEGNALTGLRSQTPDSQELVFAAIEALRLQSSSSALIQFDATTYGDLAHRPERFLCLEDAPDEPLGRWLTPLVLEPDGMLVPITYGFPRAYAIGNILSNSLLELQRVWSPDSLLTLARLTHQQGLQKMQSYDLSVINWYQDIVSWARELSTQEHQGVNPGRISSPRQP